MNKIKNLSGYQINEQLYSGARTIVHRGVREMDRVPVIIKVLHNEYPSFYELVQFRNQYTITKNLNSPFIIQTYSLEPYNNSYALITEDFGGVSLKQWQVRETEVCCLSLIEFLEIAITLCDALDTLYINKIIHKDIKPANILINPETKQVKLIDFSIASLLPRETQEIQNANALEGTLAYLSPEQTGRMNRGIDYRSDFYALGITFYELLTGKLPFASNDPLELVHCHLVKIPIAAHQIDPHIPLVLSDILNKLMAKNAEDRYQSALGIKHDLEICLDQLQKAGTIESFALGERDLSDRLIIPEKLYGRESEVALLLESFDRATKDSAEMMLVAGFSGIGKTAVVNEVHKPITKQKGYFIKGKYDQFQRNIPFSAFVQAFRDLMGQLLGESDSQLSIWKTRILEALGANGQVLIDVIPELEHIIGKQSPAPELSGSAAQNRFNLLMQKFIKVFTSKEHPLVVFLDDLQWADSASLRLLQLLMTETSHLLVLGAYRHNEVSPLHQFILTVNEISKSGAIVNTITLPPLSELDMNHLIADTLNCDLILAQPLTSLVYQKTKGNPFFATQFLKALYENGQISFNLETRSWQGDIGQIRALVITDDVVEFMALQLRKLPKKTQDVLKLAACIGAQFDLQTLAIISENSAEETATALWRALQEGLIIPNTEVYKFFMQSDSMSVVEAAVSPTYRFLHDRIQQAASTLIDQEQKQSTHLCIGTLLLEKLSAGEREERLFEIVNHFNIGKILVTQLSQREALAQLNFLAGCKAKTSTAYSAALIYITVAMELLSIESFENHYELSFGLYKERAEIEYLTGNLDNAETWIGRTLEKAKTPIEKVDVYNMSIIQYTLQAKYPEAIQAGCQALALIDINLPEENLDEARDIELSLAQNILKNNSFAMLSELPLMTQPNQKMAIKLLISMGPPTYRSHQRLWSVICAKAVNLCLQHGNTPEIGYIYPAFGGLRGYALNNYQGTGELLDITLRLIQGFNNKSAESVAYLMIGSSLRHWSHPLKAATEDYLLSYQVGLESSNLQYAAYAFGHNMYCRFYQSVILDQLFEEITESLNFSRKHKNQWAIDLLLGGQLIVLELMETQKNFLDKSAQISVNDYLEQCQLHKNWQVICIFNILKMQVLFVLDRLDESLEYGRQAEAEIINVAPQGLLPYAHHLFIYALLLATLYPKVTEPQKLDYWEKISTYQKQLEVWAQHCPYNFLHLYCLVKAEVARISDNYLEAIEYYDRAISGAKENKYLQEEALANELAAKFYLHWGKEKIAQVYMTEAYYCYAHWGAKAKVEDLETRYSHLLQAVLPQSQTSFDPLTTLIEITHPSTSSFSHSLADSLDFTSLLKAAQAISSTIELDELLQQLTQIILQNSGADKCVLILPQEGIWQVRAISTPEILEICSDPLDNHPHVPVKLIQFVKRLQAVVVIDNLKTDLPVLDDYLTQLQPKSILCLPILNQGQLVGILYLNNQATAGVFTSDRLIVINFLCTQAAISLENARLYQHAQIKAQEVEKSLQSLQDTKDKLQATEKFLRLVIDNIPQVIFWKDTQSTYLGCNRYFLQAAGLNSIKEIVGKTDYDLPWKKEESDLYRADDRRIMASDTPELGIIETQHQAGGKQIWSETNKIPLHDVSGKVIGILGTYADISDRRQLEQERSRLIAILEATSDIVSIADGTGKSLYLNQAGQQLLQISAAQMDQFHLSEVTAPSMLKAMETEILPIAIREGIWSGELMMCSRGGEEIPVSQVLMAHKNAQGEVEFFSAIMRDIRDLKRIETERQQKSAALEQALQELQHTQIQMIQGEKMSALGNLVAGVAHEINNPVGFLNGNITPALDYINDLLGLIDLYQQKYPQVDADIQEEIATIELDYIREDLPKLVGSMREGVKRIQDISISLRTFSRADTDHPIFCNIHDGIDSTIMILKHRLKANETHPDIQIIREYGNLPEIECYAGQLNQVFMNLLSNAIDALEESNHGRSYAEITNQITISTELSDDQKYLIVRIKDNGMGMSKKVQAKIFDDLFTTKSVGKGTGLGLAIAQQIIIEKHNGNISFLSELGQGTEFIITLPIKSGSRA